MTTCGFLGYCSFGIYLIWIASRDVPLTPPASWYHIILVFNLFIPVSGYYIINKVFNYYNTDDIRHNKY